MSNLTEEQIEEIAEKAAQKAITKLTSHVYQEVGKSVINKIFYITGAVALAVAVLRWVTTLPLSAK